MKTVDIIIPVFNTPAELLMKCLDSVLEQTFTDIQVIVIDDGSTESETLQVLERYSNNDNLLIHRKVNGGVSSARNYGLGLSTASYVYFLDADDYIESDHIEHMLKVANNKGTDIVFAGKINSLHNNNDAPFQDRMIDLKKDSDIIVLMGQAFTSQGVLIDGAIARSITFNDSVKAGEDTDYIIKAMSKGRSFFDGHGGYHYVQNDTSVSNKPNINNIKRYLDDSIVLRNTFSEYLFADEQILDTFLFLKLFRAFRKLCCIVDAKSAASIAKEHIDHFELKKADTQYVLKCRILGTGEKINIILLSNGFYRTAYLYNNFMIKVKN